jgi:hypothetical protein
LIHTDGRTHRHDEFYERTLKYIDIDKCFGLYRANINRPGIFHVTRDSYVHKLSDNIKIINDSDRFSVCTKHLDGKLHGQYFVSKTIRHRFTQTVSLERSPKAVFAAPTFPASPGSTSFRPPCNSYC